MASNIQRVLTKPVAGQLSHRVRTTTGSVLYYNRAAECSGSDACNETSFHWMPPGSKLDLSGQEYFFRPAANRLESTSSAVFLGDVALLQQPSEGPDFTVGKLTS
jgi:hypothetical protein